MRGLVSGAGFLMMLMLCRGAQHLAENCLVSHVRARHSVKAVSRAGTCAASFRRLPLRVGPAEAISIEEVLCLPSHG
jgi:hypothetical protein